MPTVPQILFAASAAIVLVLGTLHLVLTFRSGVEGSAGYVAMERVEGSLDGRVGGFVLQHSGTLDRGAKHLDLHVVPDSGSGQLAGLRGRMQIEITGGAHFYRFDYTLPGDE